MIESYHGHPTASDYDTHLEAWDGYGSGPVASLEPEDDKYDTVHGSDLMIAMPGDRLAAIADELAALHDRHTRGELSINDVDWLTLKEHIREVHDTYRAQYEAMAEQDKEYAQAVQDWVVAEQLRRHPAYRVDDEAEDSLDSEARAQKLLEKHLETIGIVEDLTAELVAEGEDEKLIHFADT